MSTEKRIPDDIKLPEVGVLVANFIAVLANKAYDCLGLIPGKGDVNLEQAKKAIDVMTLLCNTLDEKHKGEMSGILSTLKMAYVNKVKK